MRSLIVCIVILCFSFSINAQNTPPTLTGQSIVTLYGQKVCIDLETFDADGDTVFIGSNTNIPMGVFNQTNASKKFATGSFCITPTRGIHSYHLPYTMVFYSTDKKDTTYRSFTLTIQNYPYNVRPVIDKINYNTFRVDMKGDKKEPWESYKGLKYESKIFDMNNKVLLTDTNQVFTFTASAYEKYILIASYRTSTPATYGTRDTLYPDMNVSTHSPQKNSFTIYPNPTTGKVFIENLLQEIKAITIYDVLGKEVKLLSPTTTYFSINNLPNGMYWVEVETTEGVLSRQKINKID